jgi:fatty acid desaturase
MSDFPYEPIPVAWKRPDIDREILKQCMVRSDLQGWLHSLGTLAILATSGGLSYLFFVREQWVAMAVALYVHGGLLAFNPQTHEFSHNTVFKTRWLNELFKRVFGLVYWTSNHALYRMSHKYHHQYTLHRKSEGEEVHPRAETIEQLFANAVNVVNPTGLISTIYDQVYACFTPFLRNSRRGVWSRYAYSQATDAERRDADWTQRYQFLFHVLFSAAAIASGHWFLVVVVTLPQFYGGKWYHMWIHDTMHVARQPETDDFRLCCRSVKLDPFSSFLYWHMEWHVEHHTYAGIPCYNLKKFHKLTQEHWERPQTLVEAWREMNEHSKRLLRLPTAEA